MQRMLPSKTFSDTDLSKVWQPLPQETTWRNRFPILPPLERQRQVRELNSPIRFLNDHVDLYPAHFCQRCKKRHFRCLGGHWPPKGRAQKVTGKETWYMVEQRDFSSGYARLLKQEDRVGSASQFIYSLFQHTWVSICVTCQRIISVRHSTTIQLPSLTSESTATPATEQAVSNPLCQTGKLSSPFRFAPK